MFESCEEINVIDQFIPDNGIQARLYGDIVNISKPPPQPASSGATRGSLKKCMNLNIFHVLKSMFLI